MTYDEWGSSKWGLPGSSGRICEDDCHCVLVPVDAIPDLPAIGDQIKLRGDKDSDIRKIVEVGPKESGLKGLMEEWYKLTDGMKLPSEIYKIDFEDVEAFMRSKIKKLNGGT